MADTGFQLTPETLPAIREEYWPEEMCQLIPEGPAPDVGVIMGSDSDMRVMAHALKLLTELDVTHEKMRFKGNSSGCWRFSTSSW